MRRPITRGGDASSTGGRHYADLVVLSQDLFKVPPEKIHETKAVLTIVGGREVYAAENPAAPEGPPPPT